MLRSQGIVDIISGYSIDALGDKLAGLPNSAIQDVGQNGTTSTTPRGRLNLIGPAIEDNAGTNSKDVFPFIFARNTADFTLANSNAAQNWLAAAVDTITLEASTLYFFEAVIEIEAMGGTTHTTDVNFAGTATFTDIFFYHLSISSAAQALQATQSMGTHIVATTTGVSPTSTAAAFMCKLEGIMSINGGGTIIPQLTFSADPTGTILCKKNSHIWFRAAGADTRASAGSVA